MSDAGLILLARSGSTRLSEKSLQAVCGRPLLAHQIDRLRSTEDARVVALATTDLREDDRLAAIAAAANIATFRGCAENVVQRLVEAADAFALDFVAVVGGDDVFCDGSLVDAVIRRWRQSKADFITIEDLPFGVTPLGVSTAALRNVLGLVGEGSTDGWDRYLTDTGLFRTDVVDLKDPALAHPGLRLDVDYAEDLELVRAVYERLYVPGGAVALRDVIRLLTVDAPALADINRAVHEQWLDNRARFAPAGRPALAQER
jgi:spore coat polysaccharide biosynthesis protein SpsF (cytidylyltransferase family)